MLRNVFRKPELLAAVSVLIVITGIILFYPKTPELTVTFLDVGQGDCSIIRTPSGKVVMIDGGGVPETDNRRFDVGAKIVIPYLRGQGINKIDLMIASHPHEDHISGLTSVLKEMNVGSVLDSGYPDQSKPYLKFRKLIKSRKVPYYTGHIGTTVRLDHGIVMTILYPPKGSHCNDCNDASIIMRLQYRDASVLFAGDCSQDVEEALCETRQLLRSTVLKVGHHGSSRSTGYLWLRRVHPQVAVISAGKDNLFGHPSDSVLRRLASTHCRIYRTDQDGAIILHTDGNSITVSPFKKYPIYR